MKDVQNFRNDFLRRGFYKSRISGFYVQRLYLFTQDPSTGFRLLVQRNMGWKRA